MSKAGRSSKPDTKVHLEEYKSPKNVLLAATRAGAQGFLHCFFSHELINLVLAILHSVMHGLARTSVQGATLSGDSTEEKATQNRLHSQF